MGEQSAGGAVGEPTCRGGGKPLCLNQVTYCPRLYYLQYVDCVMPTNEHVEGGLFDHRRVDDPDLKNKTRTDRGTATSRGIALSSEALGITGVLDVIEEKSGEQYPV